MDFIIGAGFVMGMSMFAADPHYGDDVQFISKYADVIELADGQARVAVVPAWQGRVMTSTFAGEGGHSFGWIHRKFVSSRERSEQFNNYGGEDRFWLGPEGGQFGLYFEPGAPFDLAHWKTPAAFNEGEFEVRSRTACSVEMRRPMTVINWSQTQFDVRVDRGVRLLAAGDTRARFGDIPEGVKSVAYATQNSVTNTGPEAWKPETGLLSIWILGMYNPGAKVVVIVPFKSGAESQLGPEVNDAYFGKVPEDRLKVGRNYVLFMADGKHRSKIGISPLRARSACGSYDFENNILTLVAFNLPDGAAGLRYVNSMWEHQANPYQGDVVNSYNDGPPGATLPPLGPFYEIETSSPALELGPGRRYEHTHVTAHFSGSREKLAELARRVLGVSLDEVAAAFGW